MCTVLSMDQEYTNLSAGVAKCRISVISRKDFDDILSQKTFPLSRPRQEDCLPQLVSPNCPPLPPATMQRLRNFQVFALGLRTTKCIGTLTRWTMDHPDLEWWGALSHHQQYFAFFRSRQTKFQYTVVAITCIRHGTAHVTGTSYY